MKVAAVITHPEEAEGMTRWALLLARSVAGPGDEDKGSPQEQAQKTVGQLTVLLGGGVSPKTVREHVDAWQADCGAVPAVEIVELKAEKFTDEAVAEVEARHAGLLVVGKNRYPDAASEQSRAWSRQLYDLAPCDTLLLRLGSAPVSECDSVLMPSSGGPHSLAALRLVYKVVSHWGGSMTPLYVERGMGDDDGEAVGALVLDRVLREAGIDAEDSEVVRRRVSTHASVDAGIRAAAEDGSYDLLVIGSPTSIGLKRKLFGTVPDRLLSGDDAMAVAAIRARRSATHRLRERFERFVRLRVPQLQREERVGLFERLQTHSRWNFDFMALITLSTAIAALGLVVDSTAVVIGAMLVAPLMTPLLGAGLSLVQGNLPLMRTCLKSILLGFMAAIMVGVLVGLVAPLTQLTHELASRGGVRLEDMGVAFLSGVAASYCIARPGLSSALAGVAIAAALVPPIATVGISIALGRMDNAGGAAQLFAANVVAIVLGSAINFYAAGIRSSGSIVWVRRTTVLLLICAMALLVPLGQVVVSKLSERFQAPRSSMVQLEKDFAEILSLSDDAVRLMPMKRQGDRWSLRCELVAGQHPDEATIRRLAEVASEAFGAGVAVDLQVTTRLSTSVSSSGDGANSDSP